MSEEERKNKMYNDLREKRPICNVGDTFYRIIKNNIIKVKIVDIEQMKLGHYVYRDNLNYNSHAFTRNITDRYFKHKELAEEVLQQQKEYAQLKEEYEQLKKEKWENIKNLKRLNKIEILENVKFDIVDDEDDEEED